MNWKKQKYKTFKTLSTIVFLLVLGGIMGCGSGGNLVNTSVNTGTGSGDPTADTASTLDTALTTGGEAVGTALAAPAQLKFYSIVPQTINCDTSGSSSVSGDVDGGTNSASFDFDVSYQDCDGVNGTLNFLGDLTINGSAFDFDYTIDGQIGGNGCSLTFDQFAISLTSTDPEIPPTGGINGSISAQCDGASVTCEYNNVDVTDATALEAACTCSGTGC